jgi:thiol:disulfide interchange protein DsbD
MKPARSPDTDLRPGSLALLLALALAAGSSGLQAEPKLLEPERAFAFSAQPISDKTVEVRFVIADGYYLYRDRLKFSVLPPAAASSPTLPNGKIKEDPFFGKVETYRGQVAATLRLDAAEPGGKVTVRAESQGCADVGVCYPPQVQNISLTLPAPGAPPGPPISAAPERKKWFN